MNRAPLAAALCLAVTTAGAACAARASAPSSAPSMASAGTATVTSTPSVREQLDHLLGAGPLTQSIVGVEVRSLRTGAVIYSRNAETLLIPASAMKIVTAAVAAERLGWDYRFTTRLETRGTITDGVLHGDLIVAGGGDPSIAAQDLRTAPLFLEWADLLRDRGIRRVDGRLIGDDNAFDEETLGAGWAWDYLAAGYAAPSSALSYNENVAVLRIAPAPAPGARAAVLVGPPGHGLDLVNDVATAAAGAPLNITLARLPGSARLSVKGQVAADARPFVRTTSVDNPTTFFVEAFRLALLERGIRVTDGAWDIDDLPEAPLPAARQLVAEHRSDTLSSLIGYAMKVSQNFYGDMLLKAIGRSTGRVGSAESGRQAVRATLEGWGLQPASLVMYDGSGLSRYNYATASLLAGILERVWKDERLRGPYLASLPVGGHDGTLENRMRRTDLDRRVQAKTGTISNVRSLAGYVETTSGDKLVFAMIANNFTAPNAEIDSLMEQALSVLVTR